MTREEQRDGLLAALAKDPSVAGPLLDWLLEQEDPAACLYAIRQRVKALLVPQLRQRFPSQGGEGAVPGCSWRILTQDRERRQQLDLRSPPCYIKHKELAESTITSSWRTQEPQIAIESVFDELVIDNWLHLEQMDDNHWWLCLADARIDIVIRPDGRAALAISRGEYEEVLPYYSGLPHEQSLQEVLQELLEGDVPKVGEVWRHYKGVCYEIISCAVEEADLRPCIVYRSLKDNITWVRDLYDFLSTVEVKTGQGGRYQQRFHKVADSVQQWQQDYRP